MKLPWYVGLCEQGVARSLNSFGDNGAGGRGTARTILWSRLLLHG
jgi:hypothetical protein